MNRIFIKCLGFYEVLIEENAVEFKRHKTLALFLYLHLNHMQIAREKITDIFWPSFDQAHAKANLRTALSECRNLFGNEILVTKNNTVGVLSNVIETDYEQFIKLSHSKDIDALKTAVKLYGGDFLKGIIISDSPCFEDWQFEINQQVIVSYTSCLERLMTHASGNADKDLQLFCAKKLTLIAPLREDYHRNLIKFYSETGDVNSALHQFEILKHILYQDDQSNPDKETINLIKEIKKSQKVINTDSEKAVSVHTAPLHRLKIILISTITALLIIIAGIFFFNQREAGSFKKGVPIAVMPFNFICVQEGAEQNAEILTIDLITELAREDFFAVTPHGSVRHYKETAMSIKEIGEVLNVKYIIDGAAMKYDDTVRFSVQLIDVGCDDCIWADTYDCTIDNSLKTHEKIVQYLKRSIIRELLNKN